MQFYQKRRENCVKTHVILKKASFYACLTLFAGMAFPMPLWASQSTAIVQQHVKQITGIVNDTSGAPVIGANVVEVGSTTNGTITDVDGKFTLNVSVGAKLKVSYIGYNDQQITVGNSNSYTIILKEDTESLDEVVVVGYGTQKCNTSLSSGPGRALRHSCAARPGGMKSRKNLLLSISRLFPVRLIIPYHCLVFNLVAQRIMSKS